MKILNKKDAPLKGMYLDIYQTDDYEFFPEYVYIGSNGVMFNSKEEFFNISMYESVWWENGFISKFAKDKQLFENAVREREQIVRSKTKKYSILETTNEDVEGIIYVNLFHCFQNYAFGHILDTLEKVIIIEKILSNFKFDSVCFLIGDTLGISGGRETFESFIQALLPNYNLKFKQLQNNSIIKCKNLLVLKPMAHPSCISSKENMLEINKLLMLFFKNKGKQLQYKKLFLTRVPPLQRHIINFHELHTKLKANNITVIYGTESIYDIFQAFYNAETIVGYHGAMFMYQMFCGNNPFVVEFNSSKRTHHSLCEKFFNVDITYHYNIEADSNHNAIFNIDEVLSLY